MSAEPAARSAAAGRESVETLAARRLGEQLAARRRERGMTQEQLAERLGITRNQLQNIEQGWSDRAKRTPSNPRLSTLVALCRELDFTARIDVVSGGDVVVVLEQSSPHHGAGVSDAVR